MTDKKRLIDKFAGQGRDISHKNPELSLAYARKIIRNFGDKDKIFEILSNIQLEFQLPVEVLLYLLEDYESNKDYLYAFTAALIGGEQPDLSEI